MVIPILVLIGERLKQIPFLGKLIDERFLSHRRRAQRVAGVALVFSWFYREERYPAAA